MSKTVINSEDAPAAIDKKAGTHLDKGVKTTVYLTDISDFATVNQVYAQYFNERTVR